MPDFGLDLADQSHLEQVRGISLGIRLGHEEDYTDVVGSSWVYERKDIGT